MVTVANSAPTVPPRNSTQAMKVNGPCAAVYVYTHENFFLICSAEGEKGGPPLCRIVTPFSDRIGIGVARPAEWGVRELGRGQIVNGGFPKDIDFCS